MLSIAAYKGKWFAPLIDNPEYKGPWAPRQIPYVAEEWSPCPAIRRY